MNPQKHSASVAEEQMLAHFRAHAPQQPAPALDQAILAAARRQAAHVEPARPWWRRWLEASRRPRWQAAFASLLGVALVLGLVSHNVLDDAERQARPEVAFSDVPCATESPGPLRRSGPCARRLRCPARCRSPGLAGQLRIVRGGAATDGRGRAGGSGCPGRPTAGPGRAAGEGPGGAGWRLRRPGQGKAVAVKPEVLDEALGAVLALREQGKTEQAATQLAELQKRFPGENLVERLERLATIAASAKKRP